MKFMLIHTLDASGAEIAPTDGDQLTLEAWCEEMDARGIVLDGSRLYPGSDATTVRSTGGQTVLVDGPFAETKEQIAGYDLLECSSMDEALAVAAAHPTTRRGAIEVRPFHDGMPTPEVGAVAEGKRRYLLMVVGNTERMTAEREPVAPATQEEPEDDGPDPIDAWLDQVAGSRLYGWPLRPTTYSSTVRGQDGAVVMLDGPYAETKEQIAGYDLLECVDLDEAIAAAAAHPAGTVEVRPLWPA